MIKHMIMEILNNIAQYTMVYVIGAAIPFAVSVLKKAKRKTQSKSMAELYSIATDVITDLQPEVDAAKKDNKFTKKEAIKVRDKAVNDIKSLLRKNHTKLIRDIIGDMANEDMLNNVIGKLVEKVLVNKAEKSLLPDKFMGIHFDWKF